MEEPQSKFFNILFIAVILLTAGILLFFGINSYREKEDTPENSRIKSEEELLREAEVQSALYDGPKFSKEALIEDANKMTNEYQGPKYSREELLRQAEEMSRQFKSQN